MFRAAPADRSVDARRSFGVVNLDKPPGPSAHEVTAWVRDLLEVDRAAHAGTLDPGVTGCLPILTGTATRMAETFHHSDKEYVARVKLHGEPPRSLEAILDAFTGPIYQTPPRKSAVVRERRVRELYALELLERRGRDLLLRIRAERGTYIRKLCHDLGLALGTGAHMDELRRTAAGSFDDRTLVTLQELTDALAYHQDGRSEPPLAITNLLLPAERAIAELPALTVARSAAREIATGAPVYAPGIIDYDDTLATGTDTEDPLVACYLPNGAVVCLGHLVGDPAADSGQVISLAHVLIDP